MMDTYQHIQDIDNEIQALRSRIRELEEEKQALHMKLYGSEAIILERLPVRARNALVKLDIDTDLKLQYFLHGEYELSINSHFYESHYASAKTIVARLECIQNIGRGTATEAAKILKQFPEFQDINDDV